MSISGNDDSYKKLSNINSWMSWNRNEYVVVLVQSKDKKRVNCQRHWNKHFIEDYIKHGRTDFFHFPVEETALNDVWLAVLAELMRHTIIIISTQTTTQRLKCWHSKEATKFDIWRHEWRRSSHNHFILITFSSERRGVYINNRLIHHRDY